MAFATPTHATSNDEVGVETIQVPSAEFWGFGFIHVCILSLDDVEWFMDKDQVEIKGTAKPCVLFGCAAIKNDKSTTGATASQQAANQEADQETGSVNDKELMHLTAEIERLRRLSFAKHQYRPNNGSCRCGWIHTDWSSRGDWGNQYSDHLKTEYSILYRGASSLQPAES